jgi:glycerophosphoryl diester phosphodiesterase
MPTVPPGASGAAVSAHRGGSETAPEGTYRAYQDALATGADYLEFDVRRTADGELVAFHAARLGRGRAVGGLSYPELCRLAGYVVPTTSGVLELLAGRASAHIDLKEPDCLPAILSQALSLLAPEHIVVTTGDERAVSELRLRYPAVPAGLTIGGNVAQRALYRARRAGLPVRSPADAVIEAQAGWAVVQERLARAGAVAECRRRGLATMVWTVNDDAALTRWLSCPDVDVVVTDRPRRAAALRRAQR